MITRGLVLMGLSQWIGDVVTGLLIMITGVVDLYVRRVASQSLGMLVENTQGSS
jgi:ribose/xylose/arabinose/galactoside ABC-type transport system permease subunit